ncbi:PREDICTED: methyltransferase-like protein 12, mitochondrial [Nanorana parkeri]|uniref:methyltransferase-like protein 12, mitochondrial n=1 Tax=Nanorana parkeri TaxID=125878 RepID=UPI00085494A8|nr:PREDICTED: methyltransferase-like protein 12, mitochondrial [Nanorana parkeri]
MYAGSLEADLIAFCRDVGVTGGDQTDGRPDLLAASVSTPLLNMFRLHRLWLIFRQPRAQYFGTDAGTNEKGESLRNSMGDSRTWDNIYSNNCYNGFSHFDWFFGYVHLKDFLFSLINEIAPDKHTGSPIRVLDLGCGTSDVGKGLFRDSQLPLLISCIDNSAPAILAMRKKLTTETPIVPAHQDSHLEYLESDVTHLHSFLSGSVSLVLDKGTSDSLLRLGKEQAQKMVLEALRVLKKGGKLVQFTDEDPDARLPFLENLGAQPNVTFHDLGINDRVTYYAYIVTRPS